MVATSARRRTEDLLCRVGAYPHARRAYQLVFNREHYASRLRDRAFFRGFVPRKSLVFDVGANEGRMTETFLELGATVVAVEPNPALARTVKARYGLRQVTVEAAAVGAAPGVAELRLGRYNGHSTLSADWQEAAGDARWAGTVEVAVTTLDMLIARYGRPDFLKIDVEGFEAEVLAGLHQPVPAISFEFQCAALDVARRCVTALEELADYEFNLGLEETHELRRDNWTGGAELIEQLELVAESSPQGYGDVYARLRSH